MLANITCPRLSAMTSKIPHSVRLADIRDKIAKIQADIDGLAAQPLPPADALKRLDTWIHDQSARFDPASAARSFTTAGAPLGKVLETHGGGTGGTSVAVDLAPIICAMFGPEIRRRMATAIDDQATAPGPSLAERPEYLERWNAELEHLEREEEAIIRSAETAGERLARRADAPVAVVLAP